jgi:hypothetical protein
MDNLHNYSIEIKFDSETANSNEKKTYGNFLKEYGASASTVDKDGIISLFISSDKSLDINKLERELEGIEVISFEKIDLS